MDRRTWLQRAGATLLGLGAAGLPAWAGAAAPRLQLAGAWDSGPGPAGHRVGTLVQRGQTLAVQAVVDVPTRAHGLCRLTGGELLAVARRPGDWLLRWCPTDGGRALAWAWIEPDRAFNGHAIVSPDGRRVYTTETDLDSSAGLIGVRDAATLARLAEWPSHGMDPHELSFAPDGALIVANGGIPTRPETGRRKREMDRMDPSIVRLDSASGRLLGQWRLDDSRLSLRHLAWHEGLLGISLQAEHDDPQARAAAPVLALFDGQALRLAAQPRPLAGYGGDIERFGPGFAVGCPRAQGVARWDHAGRWQGITPLDEACALARSGGAGPVWAGGRHQSLGLRTDGVTTALSLPTGLRLDNHWITLHA